MPRGRAARHTAAASILLFSFCFASRASCRPAGGMRVCFGSLCVNAETAQTPQERAQGLMHRRRLEADRGMLFIFEQEDRHTFWMRNMRFSLDFIWLDRDNRVVDIHTDIPPCREEICPVIAPARPAARVLEVNAGSVERSGVRIGDACSADPLP